jgi:hypothetical protein
VVLDIGIDIVTILILDILLKVLNIVNVNRNLGPPTRGGRDFFFLWEQERSQSPIPKKGLDEQELQGFEGQLEYK